jgi:nucleotide-binding universal stress UspA family protein
VDYHGGVEGKAALRVAGEIATRAKADVTVLSTDGSRENAEVFVGSAQRYLEGFGLQEVLGIARQGQTGSETEVIRAAESSEADLVVIGGGEHGLVQWMRGHAVSQPEELTAALQRPVLVAR